jgi:hypothetical protein
MPTFSKKVAAIFIEEKFRFSTEEATPTIIGNETE